MLDPRRRRRAPALGAGVAMALAVAATAGACGGDDESASTTTRPPSTAPAMGSPVTGVALPVVADEIGRLPHVGDVVELPECGLKIEMSSDEIGFAYNSDQLDEGGAETIRAMAAQLQEATTVDIVGHTSTEGDAADNQHLSQRRAAAVEGELRDGLPGGWPGQVSSRGAGETEPKVDPELDEGGRAANRRVVLAVGFPQEVCTG